MAFLEHKPNKTLFHYTSEEGFLGIIASKQLWFSDLGQSNDPRELHIGFEQVSDAISSIAQKEFQGSRGDFLWVLRDQIKKFLSDGRFYAVLQSLETSFQCGESTGRVVLEFQLDLSRHHCPGWTVVFRK
jgi:hypothetical protein